MYQNWCKHRNNVCLGNSHSNFQLHRFTTSENITKSFFLGGRGTFLTHTVVLNTHHICNKSSAVAEMAAQCCTSRIVKI